ncbi:MAG: 16S rRNA (cytidine(1402)-2'-O)-methyltransferase [Defluviitaleaceae bacterium]|nr:16S rRNA (cytidine(1402)-2'-O)-methyltransferase [Defluviitaleaceae bacterium]
MAGTLYIVATPIGNLEDVTHRAVRVLGESGLIAAEDTRRAKTLLARYQIKTPVVSCHKFNERERLDFFIGALKEGRDVALVSDAGTPCVSDPGGRLVARAAEEGIVVSPVCGACAATAAFSVSGFSATQFYFAGFLPRTAKDMTGLFAKYLSDGIPLVFYESPKRIKKTVASLGECGFGVDLCLCNDLTKKYEKIYRGSPAYVLGELNDNQSAEKGEYVCVASAAAETLKKPAADEERPRRDEWPIEAELVRIMVEGGVSLKSATSMFHAEDKSVGKKRIYAAALNLKGLFDERA